MMSFRMVDSKHGNQNSFFLQRLVHCKTQRFAVSGENCEVIPKCIRSVSIDQIDAIVKKQAFLGQVTSIDHPEDSASAKGMREFPFKILQEFLILASGRVGNIYLEACLL